MDGRISGLAKLIFLRLINNAFKQLKFQKSTKIGMLFLCTVTSYMAVKSRKGRSKTNRGRAAEMVHRPDTDGTNVCVRVALFQ